MLKAIESAYKPGRFSSLGFSSYRTTKEALVVKLEVYEMAADQCETLMKQIGSAREASKEYKISKDELNERIKHIGDYVRKALGDSEGIDIEKIVKGYALEMLVKYNETELFALLDENIDTRRDQLGRTQLMRAIEVDNAPEIESQSQVLSLEKKSESKEGLESKDQDSPKKPTLTSKLLREKGIDLHATNNDGDTALHMAAYYNDKEAMKALIEKGAKTYTRNKAGKTALDIAFENGHIQELDHPLLSRAGKDEIFRASYIAIGSGREENVMDFLVQHNLIDETNENYNRQFRRAVLNEDLILLKGLLKDDVQKLTIDEELKKNALALIDNGLKNLKSGTSEKREEILSILSKCAEVFGLKDKLQGLQKETQKISGESKEKFTKVPIMAKSERGYAAFETKQREFRQDTDMVR
jgi:biotin operon repressor